MSESKTNASQRRVFGLDILRAIAILTVLVGHSVAHQQPPQWFRWFWGAQGTLGVELFYVLSGFLIGHILIRSARSGKLHNMADVWDFWHRRWARTLPLYLFFLLLYFRFDYLGVGTLEKDYPFLLFMQNFAWPQIPFFQHSWSLAVEEWFYFLFPLVFVWLASNEGSYRRPMLATCAVFIIGPLLARAFIAGGANNYDDFNNLIRGVVVCRLDSIFIGVLLALIKVEWRQLYDRLHYLFPLAAIAIVGISIYLAYGLPGLVEHYWAKIVFFPILSICAVLLIPGLERVNTLGFQKLDMFISYTSQVSYSLYLGHICMLTLVNGIMQDRGIHAVGVWQSMVVYAVYGLAYYGFATVTYRFIEQPYIRLRDLALGHQDVRSGNVAIATRN